MIVMTLSSRHKIRNSNYGGLRPRTLPLGHRGFRSNSQTTDNIFILCAIIDKQRCLSKPLYTCFVDFTKAFDYVDRSALYYKLPSRGIDGIFFICNTEYVLSS